MLTHPQSIKEAIDFDKLPLLVKHRHLHEISTHTFESSVGNVYYCTLTHIYGTVQYDHRDIPIKVEVRLKQAYDQRYSSYTYKKIDK